MGFGSGGFLGWLARRRAAAGAGRRGEPCGRLDDAERLVQGAEAPGLPPGTWQRPRRPPEVLPGQAVGVGATGALGLGLTALAAVALGAFAVGAVAVGAVAIGRARIRRVDIDDLTVRNLAVDSLRVRELIVEEEPGG